MTNTDRPQEPNVPLRFELDVELPGTPEQVWDAMATAHGMSAWFMPTDMEEREGGALEFHMGEGMSSKGRVIRWEPPRRLVYEEPDWAALGGHEGAPVTPLVSEFVVEAQSGGSCVLRVVTSAYGTGADWENEFFEDMAKYWAPSFDNLRLYLSEFAGQRATLLEAAADLAGPADRVLEAMRRALGGSEVGEPARVRDLEGRVHRNDPFGTVVRVAAPVEGYVRFMAIDTDPEGGTSNASVHGWLFSPNAAEYVERERDAWKTWLEGLVVPTS